MGQIRTTHAGSLARPTGLLDTMREKEHGRPYDQKLFGRQVRDAVADVVRRQREAGLHSVNDGEQGKASFYTYVLDRLEGFSAAGGEREIPRSWQVEVDSFPEYYAGYLSKYADTVNPLRVVSCTGKVRYRGHAMVKADIDNLAMAMAAVGADEGFLTAASPGGFGRNEFYPSERDYLFAVAEALREEYAAIVEAGLILQVDDPWMIDKLADPTVDASERSRRAHEHVDAINCALDGIPPEQVRYHTCYSINHGPRVHDLPMREVAEVMLRVNAGAYSFEAANPRHQHEWRIWGEITLPEDKVLLPGFIGHATNYVEHPELIAEQIANYASLVGRERVIASADCGFSSRATPNTEVHPSVVWSKFAALSAGAALATERLWP